MGNDDVDDEQNHDDDIEIVYGAVCIALMVSWKLREFFFDTNCHLRSLSYFSAAYSTAAGNKSTKWVFFAFLKSFEDKMTKTFFSSVGRILSSHLKVIHYNLFLFNSLLFFL